MITARALVTQEAVAEAAAQLVAAGDEPTIISVQARIGGGSFTTVKRYLDAWKEAQAAQPTPVAVPPAVREQASAFGRAVWEAALALPEQQIAQARAEAERVIAQLEAEADRHAHQLEEVQLERDAARAALAEATQAEQLAQVRLEEQRVYIASASARSRPRPPSWPRPTPICSPRLGSPARSRRCAASSRGDPGRGGGLAGKAVRTVLGHLHDNGS